MVWICPKCGMEYKELPHPLKCPVKDCGCRYFFKKRAPLMVKRLKAR